MYCTSKLEIGLTINFVNKNSCFVQRIEIRNFWLLISDFFLRVESSLFHEKIIVIVSKIRFFLALPFLLYKSNVLII